MFTMGPEFWFLHLRDHLLRHEEGADHIGVFYQIVVVFGERLGNGNACVVNQQVDTAEMLDCCLRYFDGGLLLAESPSLRTRSADALSSLDLLILQEVPITP
jgi:hypothetical protein